MRSIAPVSVAVLLCAALGVVSAQQRDDYEESTKGTRWLEGRGGLKIKVLVEAANLGSGEVELGEITFPAGSQGGDHRHGSIEIFYVLEGVMEHVVNGEVHRLEPGDVGIVKPGDSVSHRVEGDQPVRALVIWAPGGEAERIAGGFSQRPIDD